MNASGEPRRAGPARSHGRRRRQGGSLRRPPARGFTLVEILLATVLLATALALAFATLRAATGVAMRGEAEATRSERMRAVGAFLRSRLAGARMQGFEVDPDSGLPVRFVGEPDHMRFVADLPAYLGHGGPYIHDLQVAGDAGERQLLLGLQVLQPPADGPLVADERPPEVLAEALSEVRFRYRALDEEGRLGEWSTAWASPEQLPLQVEVSISDAEGRAWPVMVVALPLSAASGGSARGGLR